MDTSTSSVKFADEFAMKSSNIIYKKRPPTPTRKRFELGELDNESNSNSKSSRLNPDVEREENALKEELLRIFGREKDAMESHYLGKIQELLRSFKGKKLEWEEMVRAEREDLERQFESERTEIHQSFAQEITKMTRAFQEEKIEVERKYEDRQKARENDIEREKHDLSDKWKLQMDITRKECERDFDMKLDSELRKERERYKNEMEMLEKKLENAQYDLDKRHERELHDAETKFQKVVFDMERKFEEEKNKLEKDWQRRVENIEDSLRKETNYRIETEKLAAHDKENLKAVNAMLKDEITRLKDEIDRLRKQPIPQPEVKIVEKFTEPVPVCYNSRADLPSGLRDDFDRIINDYKSTLKEKFDHERANLEEKLQQERDRFKDKIAREKEELDKKLNEEKFRMERDLDRSKDDIEKEIERRLRTKQLSDSLLAQQQKFDEVARRLEEEEKNRYERLRETEFRKFESKIDDLRRENDGLKAKVHVLEDNNKVLKSLKEEGQKEVERLRVAVEELKTVVESKRDSDRTRAQTPAEFTPFLMSMMQHQQQQQSQQDEPISQKSQLDELYCERKKLEELKNDLHRQELEIRERRTMEDASKMANDKHQEKYESLLQEKRKLERQLQTLESRVVNMQDEFVKLRTQQAAQQQQQLIHPQPIQPQPIIVQSPPSPTKELRDPQPPVNVINFPGHNTQPQIQQQPPPAHAQQPTIHPYYLQSMQHMPQPPMFSPNDQSEKISRLKTAKERLTRQVEELQRELRDANQENSLLQKQCQDYERRLDKIANALDREQELTSNLKDALNEEKMRVNRLKDDVERESENVVRARTEIEDVKISSQQEIQDLQTKLHNAGLTLATVRQQAANDIKAANTYVSTYPQVQPPKDPTVNLVTLPSMPQVAPYYHANAARRRLSLSKTMDSFTAVDLDQVRSLEEEKLRLQRQLQDAKGALDAYAGKLGQQVNQVHECDRRTAREQQYNMESKTSFDLTKCHDSAKYQQPERPGSIDMEKSPQQVKHLRQQKLQLQKLIERLTYVGPQPQQYQYNN